MHEVVQSNECEGGRGPEKRDDDRCRRDGEKPRHSCTRAGYPASVTAWAIRAGVTRAGS